MITKIEILEKLGQFIETIKKDSTSIEDFTTQYTNDGGWAIYIQTKQQIAQNQYLVPTAKIHDAKQATYQVSNSDESITETVVTEIPTPIADFDPEPQLRRLMTVVNQKMGKEKGKLWVVDYCNTNFSKSPRQLSSEQVTLLTDAAIAFVPEVTNIVPAVIPIITTSTQVVPAPKVSPNLIDEIETMFMSADVSDEIFKQMTLITQETTFADLLHNSSDDIIKLTYQRLSELLIENGVSYG